MKHDGRFLWLDLVRGLSAIAVCAGHLRAAVFIDYSNLQSVSFFQKFFYAITGLGHQAVMVFFVLSGFFVGGSILKNGSKFSWTEYAIARLTRLWVVLIPALIITFVVDQFIKLTMPDVLAGMNYSMWNSGPQPNGKYSQSLITFLGNIFFTQTILTPIFGSNGPLWSLANEFWYYVIFPLLVYSFGYCYYLEKPRLAVRFAAGAVAVFIFFMLPSGIKSSFFIWLLGVVVFLLKDKSNVFSAYKYKNYLMVIIGVFLFLFSLAYSKSDSLQANLYNISSDIVVGLGATILCYAIVYLSHPPFLTTIISRAARSLSDISYSLYLLHFPLVVLIGAFFYESKQLVPNIYGFAHYLCWLALLLIGSVMFWWIFEKRTDTVRKFVRRYLLLSIVMQNKN